MNWRQNHNKIKFYNLKTAFANSPGNHLSLIDFGCGRGGDLGKWQNLNKNAKVLAIDMDQNLLDDAITRYHHVYQKKDKRMKVYFHKMNILNPAAKDNLNTLIHKKNLIPLGNYNIASCQMVLNHLLSSAPILSQFFDLVSLSLCTGGIASFSALNGERVCDAEDDSVYIKPLFSPSDIPDDKICYGLKYKIFINPKKHELASPYFLHTGMNTEYLLFKETIMDALPPSLRLEQDFTEFNIDHPISKFYFSFSLKKIS